MKNTSASKLAAYVFLSSFAIFGTSVSPRLSAEEVCLPIFKAAEVARRDYSKKLKEHPVETDFDAYVSDIVHYDISLSDSSDNVTVRFKLRKDGEVITGGAATYVIRKDDMKILDINIEK